MTVFQYAGSQVLREKQGANYTATYTYGNALIRKDSEVPLFDGLGSERTVTDGSQNVTVSPTHIVPRSVVAGASPCISPNGAKMAYVSGDGHSLRLRALSGGRESVLMHSKDELGLSSFTRDGNGVQVVHDWEDDGLGDVVLVDIRTASSRVLFSIRVSK